MRVLIAGNLANTGYYIAKLLRTKGIDTDLLMKKNDLIVHDPRSLDNMIEYPEWIKFWDGTKRNWKLAIVRMMKKYDIIHASTELPIFALFSRKPYIAMTTGDDIVELAQQKTIKGILLKCAYKKARAVVYTGTYMYPSVIKLKLRNALFIPLVWDYEKFNPQQNRKTNEKFIIFHPTNHYWKDKGNDIFLKAFVKLAKTDNNVHLVTINRGRDFQQSLEILNVPELREKFTILPETLPQNQLPQIYASADVIVDQFVSGSIGLIGQEAMASEKPLISHINTELYQKIYGDIPPILNAKTENEIYNLLVQISSDTNMRHKIGKESRKWLLKHHNTDTIIEKYIYLYRAVLDKIDYTEIKRRITSTS
ncbi:MAG: glycosyltransferase family 4 protein [Nitrososphaera sp.]|jgi:glycosyltransferase involved in cell wall biosynthesis